MISGVHRADGIVGDLGGGSLELVDVRGTQARHGVTRPLGGLALADISAKSVKKAEKFVSKTLRDLRMLRACEGRIFYAVGGTWRSLARLHMWQTGYPLHVMHGYAIAADEALEFARLLHRVDVETLSNIEVVNNARRPLLPYAALVLEHVLRVGKPRQVVFSALGIREGLLFSLLKKKDKEKDALIEAARHLNQLRSRSPLHGEELIPWTDRFMATSGLDETGEERRLRHAACLLADIGWRAHPDYRGEQSLNIIAHARLHGDRPSRPRLSRAVGFLPPCRTGDGRRTVAAAARTGVDAHARSRPRARRGAPSRLRRSRPRCRACCLRPRLPSSAIAWRCGFPANSPPSTASASPTGCARSPA